MEFQAKIHGIEFKQPASKPDSAPQYEDPQVPMFRDPKEYEGMSKGEREQLTKQMIAKHKKWNKSR